MSILERVGGWLRLERRSTLAAPERWHLDAWGAAPSLSGVAVTPTTAMRATAVYACVRLLAESVASLPVHVYRRRKGGGKERANEHPLYGLLHSQPNPLMTSADMLEAVMAALVMRGPGYARTVRNGAGDLVEIIPYAPDRIERRARKDGRGFVYTLDGDDEIQHDEMWHPRGFTLDGLNAISPITYAREAIGLALAAEQHGASVMANAARPSGVLTTTGTLTPEAAARLKEGWQASNSGHKMGGVAVLEQGMDWKPLTMNAEDAAYIETRKFQLGEIARMFRVPPHMIGDLERATFSNIEHQSIDFVRHTIRPWLVKLEQSASRDLLLPKERGEFFVEFNVDGLLRGDTLTRYQVHQIAIQNGLSSSNEIRALENQNPRDGGDAYLTPLNMTASGDEPPAEGDPNADDE